MNDKLGRRLFQTGAVILVLLGLVHCLSLIKTPVPANDTERQLLDLMASYTFDLMGSRRSMDNLLRGFSITFALCVLAMGALDLLIAREKARPLKTLALVNVIWLAAMTANSLYYFFAAPTAFLVTALVIFFLAWLKLPSQA